MKPIFAAGILTFALAGCEGFNPLTNPDPGGDDGATVTDGKSTFTGDVDGVTYDASNDTLVISDLPFDGKAGRYVNTGITAIPGFGVYRSRKTAEAGQFRYYAVYGEGQYGAVAAVGTGDFGDFGHGGAMFTKTGGKTTLPTVKGELVYTGNYAGIQVSTANAGNDLGITSGDAELIVDVLDPSDTLAVIGTISNHKLYDTNGNFIADLPPLGLDEAGITSDGKTTGSSVSTFDANGKPSNVGEWNGQLVGPNGEELIGFLVATEGELKETGVFIVVD